MSNYSGIILALLIALGIGWLWNKGRKKWGAPANGKTLIGAVIVIAVVLFLIYGASHTPHS